MLHRHEEIPQASYQANELNEMVVGLPALNPFAGHVSGPRAAMFNKHVSQRPTLINPSSQRLFTGVSTEMGKYTFKKQIHTNSYIVDVVSKYANQMLGDDAFKNPLSTVIFECAETQVIDCLDLDTFHSSHQYFGFEYKYNPDAMYQVRPGNRVPAGLVIADSPSKNFSNDDYKFGIHANIALMSDPVVIEDGIKISETFAKRLQFNLFETRQINFNPSSIGLNIYGNKDNYKLFPNIGEKIRDDGIVFATRDLSRGLEPCDLSYKSLMNPTIYDTCIYGKPGAEVIDIEIIKGDLSGKSVFLSDMEKQLEFHHNAKVNYHLNIKKVYDRLKSQYGTALKLSPRFSRLVKESIAVLESGKNKLSYRGRDKLVGWTVKVTYKHAKYPKEGFKLTNVMGGKGVVCHVVPDEQMPVNNIGVRADMLMDNQAPYKRTIMGVHHEIYINGSIDKIIHDLRQSVKHGDMKTYEDAWSHVLGFYKIVSPRYYELLSNNPIDIVKHIDEIITGNMGVWLPVDNPVDYIEVIDLLEKYYPAVIEPVSYISQNTGEKVTTKLPILIGGMYVILLDKIATENASVSSAKTQHFGIPSKLNKTNKYYSPARDQPTKTIAEDESRLLEAVAGGRVTADLLDQTNNPDAHRAVLRSIYEAKKPSAVKKMVDRSEIPTGHGNIQNMVNNILECAGVEFAVVKGED